MANTSTIYVSICSGKFIARQQWFAIGDEEGCVHVYDYSAKHNKVQEFQALCGISVDLLAVHPSNPFLLTASSSTNSEIKLWDWSHRWKCTRTFERQSWVHSLTWSLQDSDTFISGSGTGVKVIVACSVRIYRYVVPLVWWGIWKGDLQVWKIGSSEPTATPEDMSWLSNNACYFYGDSHRNFIVSQDWFRILVGKKTSIL